MHIRRDSVACWPAFFLRLRRRSRRRRGLRAAAPFRGHVHRNAFIRWCAPGHTTSDALAMLATMASITVSPPQLTTSCPHPGTCKYVHSCIFPHVSVPNCFSHKSDVSSVTACVEHGKLVDVPHHRRLPHTIERVLCEVLDNRARDTDVHTRTAVRHIRSKSHGSTVDGAVVPPQRALAVQDGRPPPRDADLVVDLSLIHGGAVWENEHPHILGACLLLLVCVRAEEGVGEDIGMGDGERREGKEPRPPRTSCDRVPAHSSALVVRDDVKLAARRQLTKTRKGI